MSAAFLVQLRPKKKKMCVSDFSLEKLDMVSRINILSFKFSKILYGIYEIVNLCHLSAYLLNFHSLGLGQKPSRIGKPERHKYFIWPRE